MFTLAQLSDVHLAPLPAPTPYQLISKRALGYINWRRRRFRHQRAVLDRLVADLLASKPDHIAVTGDLVNIALPEEFILARSWLDQLGGPEAVTVIPGNHDAYVPFVRAPGIREWQPYMLPNEAGARFAEYPNGGFPFVRQFGEIALVCLSSARPTPPGMASGWLGRRQLHRLASILDTLGREGVCRIVLIHHPPLPGMTPWQRALHDAGALRKVLERHGAELVLHGHNHRAMFTALETRCGPAPIVGAPSASVASEKPAEQAGYNLFRIAKGGNRKWRISSRFRVFDPSGGVTDTYQDLLP